MIYSLIGGAILAALAAVGGYTYGYRAGVDSQQEAIQGWIKAIAEQDAEIQRYKDESAAREKASKSIAARAETNLKAERAKHEKDRAKWASDARSGWTAHIDRVLAEAASGKAGGGSALSTCTAERDATRAGLEQLLTAGEHARAACDRTRLQLVALLGWLHEQTLNRRETDQ